ncbi:DEAD/DEAH box helicase [Actinosynnema sp. CA-248983]
MRAAEQRLSTVKAETSRLEPLDRLRANESRMLAALAELAAEREKAKSTVCDRCRVMGATVSKAIQSRTLLDGVDVVVIDEAGMVALPQAWCVAGLARKRVAVVGDFRQLPAVTHSTGSRTLSDEEREHAKRWMDRDVFNAAGLVDANGMVRPDSRMICLEAQYRMRPAIWEVVNEVAYRDAPLRTRRDDVSRIPPSPLVPAPLVLVDTAMRRMPHARGRADGHKTNPVHEAVIHELVRGLQHDTALPARKWTDRSPTDTMAVIVPYRDQAKVLSKSLHHRFGEGYEGMVDTVHRFQGSQRPLIVIDTVAGAGSKLGYFYEGTGLSSTTCRLLNVALSRAQDHLVVVADVEFLTRRAPRWWSTNACTKRSWSSMTRCCGTDRSTCSPTPVSHGPDDAIDGPERLRTRPTNPGGGQDGPSRPPAVASGDPEQRNRRGARHRSRRPAVLAGSVQGAGPVRSTRAGQAVEPDHPIVGRTSRHLARPDPALAPSRKLMAPRSCFHSFSVEQ